MLKKFMQPFAKPHQRDYIIVVSGLPRSGTSMMMKMLEAADVPILTDNLRTADEDNPKGYYEFERVKKLEDGDSAWLTEAQGKAVKVIAALLPQLPTAYRYRILFMRRAMPEVLASQREMLVRRGEDPNRISDEELTKLFEKHLQRIDAWLAAQPHMKRLDVDYNQLLANPMPQVEAINRFLDDSLDEEKMVGVIDPDLYRQRRH